MGNSCDSRHAAGECGDPRSRCNKKNSYPDSHMWTDCYRAECVRHYGGDDEGQREGAGRADCNARHMTLTNTWRPCNDDHHYQFKCSRSSGGGSSDGGSSDGDSSGARPTEAETQNENDENDFFPPPPAAADDNTTMLMVGGGLLVLVMMMMMMGSNTDDDDDDDEPYRRR